MVINLVGILNEKGRDGSGFRQAHSELAAKLVDACRLGQVRRLIQISALKANAESGPSHYLRTKGEAEQIIREQAEDIQWTILQPSVIYGPGDSFTNRFARLLRRIPVFFPLAKPDALFAPVHVDDVVRAIRTTVSDAGTAGETYELFGAEVYSLKEIVARICQAIGIRRKVIGLPDWASRLQAGLMEFAPGKPFSIDNYNSLSVPSVGTRDGLASLGIKARSFDLNLESCLGRISPQTPLDRHRRQAGRQTG